MANSCIFSDLKSGRCSSAVEFRLLRFWEAKNVKRGGELMWLDMLFVDVNPTLMQASINSSRLPTFRPRLTAGSIYSIPGFDVAGCAHNFRLTDSSLLIRFSDSTELNEITESHSQLTEEGFSFRNENEILGLANTNTQIPDIIGEITGVKSTVSDPPGVKNHVMATIKLYTGVSVTLSIFDSQAVDFHTNLEAMREEPRVIVATSINPNMVGASAPNVARDIPAEMRIPMGYGVVAECSVITTSFLYIWKINLVEPRKK